MSEICQEDGRRSAVRSIPNRNGLDYVEVEEKGRTLFAYFLGKMPHELRQRQREGSPYLELTGGDRRKLQILGSRPVTESDPEKDDMLEVFVDGPGDASIYTLRLVGVENIDPRYDRAEFRFGLDCPSELDCLPVCAGPEPAPARPDINYLAKDYASFRRLMLDRMSVAMPDWTERHAADLGITLVELLAYAADYLSYYQDAVATEAYLETARQRISVRRHVRLLDYRLSEGCNARAWVCLGTDVDFELDPARMAFATGLGNSLPTVLGWDDLAKTSFEAFEPLVDDPGQKIEIRAAHSAIALYTWGGFKCHLKKGTTRATLRDEWAGEEGDARRLQLQPGDVLILEETIGPRTGLAADADPTHRCAVRLTKVTPLEDPVYPDGGRPTPLLEIEWDAADRLPFALCLSAVGPAPECRALEGISVARGNVVLVDHGQTQPPISLGMVPMVTTSAVCDCIEEPGEIEIEAGPFAPILRKTPLTYRAPVPAKALPASQALVQEVAQSLIDLSLASSGQAWTVRYDLIESHAGDTDFVVELDDEGFAHFRFGDGELGAQPSPGTEFQATYRIGNGKAGNVGAEAIAHLVLTNGSLDGPSITVRNPLPAMGGQDAEPIEEAKRFAPGRFRTQLERAIVAEDYEKLAERDPRLQGAAARLAWTGSWYEADVALDPLGTEGASEVLLRTIERELQPFRRIGHDLRVVPARAVPLEIALQVCVGPHFERGTVAAALRAALGTGRAGFFNPDRLTFGGSVYLSQIVAAAQEIDGVTAVNVLKFGRFGAPSNGELASGTIPLAHDEIAMCDNDPDRPERGKLELNMTGGR